jgi:hypothetical protein
MDIPADAALIATALHTVSYLAVTALIATLVFEKFGVGSCAAPGLTSI